MEELIIGIDIGGTTIKFGLLNESGEVIHKWRITTNNKDHGNYMLEI